MRFVYATIVASVYLLAACGDAASPPTTQPPPVTTPPRDLTAPTLVLGPQDSLSNATSITVLGTATDSVGVKTITSTVTMEGGYPGPPTVTYTPGKSVSFQVFYAYGPTGRYTVYVEAADSAGNIKRDSVRVSVDRDTPFFRAVAPFVTAQSAPLVAVYGLDVGSDTLRFTWSVDGGPESAPVSLAGTPNQFPILPKPWDFAGAIPVALPTGASTLTIRARDRAGNMTSRVLRTSLGTVPQSVATGPSHMCGLMPGGSAVCWGSNSYGQLGDGTTTNRSTMVAVNGAPAFAKIAVGQNQSCGITAAGDLYCWGRTPPGDAALPPTTMAPRKVNGIPPVAQVTLGVDVLCILATDGTVWCWGKGTQGELGDGLAQDRPTPQQIAGGRTYVEIAGRNTICALTAAGEAWCWGDNSDNLRGDEAYVSGQPPLVQATPFHAAASKTFTHLTVGYRTACGLQASGPAICWGHADEGKLGTGAGIGPRAPAPILVSETVVSLATPTETGCAATAMRRLYCWGSNFEGTPGGMLNIPSPYVNLFSGRQFVPVRSLVGIEAVEVTGMHFSLCVRDLQGSLYCFGPSAPVP
jgi:hypothetical protein